MNSAQINQQYGSITMQCNQWRSDGGTGMQAAPAGTY